MVRRTITFAVLSFVLQCGSGVAQQCLHGSGETPDQQARRKQAVAAARRINTMQHNRPEARNGVFLTPEDLATMVATAMPGRSSPATPQLSFAPDTDIVPGWRLTLDVTTNGYWFAIKDTTDSCGFTYISNTSGLIYTAHPLQ